MDTRIFRFRNMAETLQEVIDAKRADRDENTPKRCRQAMQARCEANHLERVQTALRALKTALMAENLPTILQGIKSKKQLMGMTSLLLRPGLGYYDYAETDEFYDQSDEAQALRTLMNGSLDETQVQADEDRQNSEDIQRKLNNMGKIPGFYPTPTPVIDQMIEWAELGRYHSLLEPSAGSGAILKEVQGIVARTYYCEIVPVLRNLIEAQNLTGICIGEDFLAYTPKKVRFNRILMNPPFERGQDMAHVLHAYGMLEEGGRLVAIMSPGAFFRSDKQATDFQEWFKNVDGVKEDLPEGSFKESGTGVSSCMVVIDKKEEKR